MLLPRVTPCLLFKNGGLIKTVKFKNPVYVGDPINAVKVFNEKEVDELIFIDIAATQEGRSPPFELIEKIASECFMPVCYGGGIRSIIDIKRIFALGVEKVSIGSYAVENPPFIKEAVEVFGSQSIVVCIDVKKNFLGRYEVMTRSATKNSRIDPVTHAKNMEALGAGELLINSIDRDGTMLGYDIALVKMITKNVGIPVVACGGAGGLSDISKVIHEGGASSAAAGSLFVFYGRHRAVLINYPNAEELERFLG